MPRKRMLDPHFFVSKTMNDLPIQTMLTFAGIWCWADDYGRGEDDADLVKAAVWPRRKAMTEKKVRNDMDALAAAGTLCKYEVGGFRLIHVVSWGEHQKISHPTSSKLPPCPIHEGSAWEEFLSGSDESLHRFRSDSGMTPELVWSAS